MNPKRITQTLIIAWLVIGIGLLIGSESVAKAQGESELNQQLARVRAATAKYHDLNVAIADGFVPFDTCILDANGATGFHFVNVARFVSPQMIIEEPELLVYTATGDGNLRLAAVEYSNRVLYRDTRSPDTPGYRPGVFPSQQNPRPPYLQEVSGQFSLFGQPAEGPEFFGRWTYSLHAWVWLPNPNGIFAARNPLVRCQ